MRWGMCKIWGEGEGRRYTFWTFMEKLQEKMTLARPKGKSWNNIKMGLRDKMRGRVLD
jgi:hypothetical protein